MSILSWILLGLIAGFIGSKIVNRSGEGLMRTSCRESLVRLSWARSSRRSALPGYECQSAEHSGRSDRRCDRAVAVFHTIRG